ncbi:hypothetical protein SAMN02745135_02523 [Caloranaerobacter azorensis DSM 13643]|uniref:Uncharacterized protein n=1 Tax=Caloranaerobacter azorensis DSM 13643 TaxID=1121264 RepID=A0A1M5WKD8_9FIRM|nr:hypothetical protein [Caloranaerobacter azorensis]SHH87917.1 hypothetical protein SAMN02745135_02523 [Caloranaerobacter azorensis DSM 13643]
MNKKTKILIITIVVIIIVGIYFFNNRKTLVYNEFDSISNYIIEELKKEYPLSYIEKPTITVYPGNDKLNKYWVNTTFNALNDNTAFLKQKSIYILNQEKNIATKIIISYEPNIKQKYYLSVNRIDSIPIDYKELNVKLSPTFSNSITANGLFIQVTTICTNQANINREFEKNMIKINTDITSKIQEYILKIEK